MADAAPVVDSITMPPPAAESKPAAETAPDPKAEINAALKKAGVKLKAKDREYVPRDIDDLTSKAQRVYGLEAELEKFKSEKTEAEGIKSWKAAIEADDEAAAERAFDSLSPKAQQNAAKWLQRKAQAYESERQLSPEALEFKRQMEERESRLRQYEEKEQRERSEAEKRTRLERIREAHGSVLKVAQSVTASLKASDKVAPALVPLVARHMRVALAAAEEAGVPVDEEAVMREVADNVRADTLEQFATVADGMDDDALYDAMGEKVAKRLMRVALKRRGQGGVRASEVTTTQRREESDPKKDPRFGTPGYFR